ncbi:MAG: response regulator, partial [Clostridia bacterium]|nr:response regulator [Clostridia bacterium]
RLIWARNGEEAVEMYKVNNPAVILMDIKMPVMDGLEATKIIRKYSKDVIIIAQTANAFESDHKKAIEAGCNDVVTKPIRSSVLLAAIKKHLPQ